MVGRLDPVPLRDVWAHEAKDFTSWLSNNIDILNEQIGLLLTVLETEKSVGTFSADILAEDSEGRPVIIENQLEKTDHDHLGKLLTYLSNLEAKTAIWISSDPRPEHQTAINYLNEVVPEDTSFYLIKVQAFKIEESQPAPLFSAVAGPSPELKESGRIKKEMAGTDALRFQFFEQLLKKSNQKFSLFEGISPQGYQQWVVTSAGKSGIAWHYFLRNRNTSVEFHVNSPDEQLNTKRFEFLQDKKDTIEGVFGEPLEWNYKEGRKQHYIKSLCNLGGLKDQEKWDEIQNDLVGRMERMVDAIGQHIQSMP